MRSGVWKNVKMMYSAADNSAISKDRALGFALLERAFRAVNWANGGFSKYRYSSVLQ
jgi:hypothetical protein